MADQDAKRKRPITCLETGVTYDSAYRAAKELGFADSRNIFRSIQRGTCTQGLHFYYADAPKPAPGFFLPPNRPPRPVVCLDTGETFESAFQAGRAFGIAAGAVRTSAITGVHGRRARRAPLLLRRRAEADTGVLQGTPFEDQAHRLPGNRRDFRGQPGRRPPPACIARRHQPGRPLRYARRRAPFLPWRRAEAGAGVLQAGEGEMRQEPCGDGCRGEDRHGEWLRECPGRYTAESTRGIIVTVGKAPSVSEGAFLFFGGCFNVHA